MCTVASNPSSRKNTMLTIEVVQTLYKYVISRLIKHDVDISV